MQALPHVPDETQGKKRNHFDFVAKCGAKSKSTGKPCRQIAMRNGRCRIHGGKTPSGIASPHFKTGKHTRYPEMKGSLAEAVERAHNDPELLNLTTEVALLQARLGQLIDKIEPEESLGRWKKAQEQFKMLLDARARKDGVGFGQSLEELRIIFRDGLHDHLIWSEIRDTLKDLRGIVAQEQKRRMDMNALISADQAVGMISEILYAAKEHVSDPKELNALYRAAQDIITRNPSLNR